MDAYIAATVVGADEALAGALAASEDAGLPAINVAPNQGKLLHLLARAVGARRVLEVGTLGGYSTIWLARALPPGGRLLSLELDPRHAEVARANLAAAGLSGAAEVRVGPALAALEGLAGDAAAPGAEPWDFVFIDADKPNNPAYFDLAVGLTRPGGMVVVDNVVRDGRLADATSEDPGVLGSRRLMEAMGSDPRVAATALQTVGVKGYDGIAVALVVG